MPKAKDIDSLIKQWMSNYPEEHRPRLKGRLESRRVSDYLGARFELTVHEFFRTLGWNPTVDPPTDFGTPDFRAVARSDAPFYCEATVIDPSVFHATPREQQVFDELGKLSSPNHILLIEVEGELLSNPPLGNMKRHFQRWIDDSAALQDDPLLKRTAPPFQHEGWSITLTVWSPIPSSTSVDNPCIGPFMPFGIDPPQLLVDKIKEKNSRYRGIDGPLLVAVHDVQGSVDPKLDVPVALFGWEKSTGDHDRVDIHRPTGIGKPNCLWDGLSNNSVSAILLCKGAVLSDYQSFSVCIYENPFARFPLPSQLLRLPHAKVEGRYLQWFPGEDFASVMHIPEPMPKFQLIQPKGIFRR